MHAIPDATRAAALARLAAFAPAMGRAYAAGRNHDHGPRDRGNVSVLSPHVRHRLVTEAELVGAALANHAPGACEKFVQEVFWRSYWKGWLEQRPSVWADYRERLAREAARLSTAGGLRRAYEDAVSGRTGIACFDAWARELVETGYLHNHARMWFASIWIFTLRLPWVLGADLTYRHFMDGDPASNTLSWRWVAGLHTRGKHYLARAANIADYTGGRFNPEGELDERAAPLDEPDQPPSRVPIQAADAPPAGRVALLVTEEDLCPETLPLGHAHVIAAAGATCTAARSILPIGAAAERFATAAMDDALARAGAAFGVAAEHLTGFTAVADWAAASGAEAVVTAYAPAGPVAAALDAAAPALAARGLRLLRVRRAWDDAVWPHATRGFFQVKDRIPAILRALGPEIAPP
jgi:deoxyribodipyrimidine photo-lyase